MARDIFVLFTNRLANLAEIAGAGRILDSISFDRLAGHVDMGTN